VLYNDDPDGNQDLMWSDPDDVDNWAVSPRGAGWLFGGAVTKEVNHPTVSPSPFLFIFYLPLSLFPVQSRQLPHPHRPRAPTRPRRLQIHVRRTPRHRLVCPQLLLSLREYGEYIND